MAETADNAQIIAQTLLSNGWESHQVAAILGHLQQESGLQTCVEGDGGTSCGIAQWHKKRFGALKQFADQQGSNWRDAKTQALFLDHELNTTEKFAGDKLRAATTVDAAAEAFMHFERPSGYSKDNPKGGHGWDKRLTYAQSFAGAIGEDGISSDLLAEVNSQEKKKSSIPNPAEMDRISGEKGWQENSPEMLFFMILMAMLGGEDMMADLFGDIANGNGSAAEKTSAVKAASRDYQEAKSHPLPIVTEESAAVMAPNGKKPEAFIMHHTGGRGSVEGVVATLKQRGLGVQYIMDRDGKIYSTENLGLKMQHIRQGEEVGKGLSNANTVGMEIIAKDDDDITPQQVEAAKAFMIKYYPDTRPLGHGEVNSHKQETEGQKVTHAIEEARAEKILAANADLPAAKEAASGVSLSYNDVPGGMDSIRPPTSLPAAAVTPQIG